MTFRHTPFREILAFQRAHVGSDWYRIQNLADGSTQVMLFDDIGFFGTTASDFLNELSGIPGPIDLHLNSQGGEVFEGLAIYSALRQRGGVKVVIDGVAASIASVIAMAASPGQLYVARNGQIMIHDAFMAAAGNAADLREMAALLDEQSDNIADIYSQRSGKPSSYWREQMRAESWYRGQKAVDAGLADALLTVPALAGENTLTLVGQAGGHAPMTGTHSHGHGPEDHTHEHSHDGDAAHSHGSDGGHRWDPDGDGDDDMMPEGDTDHDYWSADGEQLKPVPGHAMSDAALHGFRNVKKPHGDVPYADPGYLDSDGHQASKSGNEGVARYPIDAEHVQAAWSYINQEKNAKQYTAEQLAAIKSRIKSAMKKHGHDVSEDHLDIDLGILRNALKGANA